MRKAALCVIVISLIAVPWTVSAEGDRFACWQDPTYGAIFCPEVGDCTGWTSGSDERKICADSDGTEVCIGPEGWGHWEICKDPVALADAVAEDAEEAAEKLSDEIDQAVNDILGEYKIDDITRPVDQAQRNASRTVQETTDSPVRWRLEPCAHGGDGVRASVTYDGMTTSDDDEATVNASQDGEWDQADVWSCDSVDLSPLAAVWNQGYRELKPLVFYDPCQSRSEAGARSQLGDARGEVDAWLGDGDEDPCDAGVDHDVRLGGDGGATDSFQRDRSVGVAPPPRLVLSSDSGSAHAAGSTAWTMESSGLAGAADPFVGTDPALGSVAIAGTIAAGWVLFILYRRLTAEDILENEIRSSMIEMVRAAPAINAGKIADELGVAVATVLYHGRVLDESGHLERCRDGREVVFYPTGELQPVEKALHKVAKQETKLAILDALDARPGASMSELARLLDKHRSTVKHHVDDLVDRDLVVKEATGRSSSLELAEPTAQALARREAP